MDDLSSEDAPSSRGFYEQARHFTPGYAKRVADLIRDVFPIRFEAIHLVNQPWIFGAVLAVIWPFLSAKIQKRVRNPSQGIALRALLLNLAFWIFSRCPLSPDIYGVSTSLELSNKGFKRANEEVIPKIG